MQRRVVDAFLAASRAGDYEALVATLAPDVVLRADLVPPGAPPELRGAEAVARSARSFSHRSRGKLLAAMHFRVANGHVVAIDVVTDAKHLAALEIGVLDA